MKRNAFVLIICLLVSGFSWGMGDDRKLDKLENEILEMKIRVNQEEIATAIAWSRERVIPLGVFGLGGDWVEDYMMKNKKLRELREEFNRVDEALREVLRKDAEYRDSLPRREKARIFARLHRTSEEYREARARREKALTESNTATLERLAKEYKAKRMVLGTPFIDKQVREQIEEMNPRIVSLQRRLRALEGKYARKLKE